MLLYNLHLKKGHLEDKNKRLVTIKTVNESIKIVISEQIRIIGDKFVDLVFLKAKKSLLW